MSDASHDPNVQDPEISDEMMVILSVAKSFEHSGRTLYDHLLGTYHLLRQWECERDVCIAGLFHSIYGTQVFKQTTLGFHNRERVSRQIGYEAEHLAYLFCVTKRPDVLLDAYINHHRYLGDSHTGLGVYVSEEVLQRLIEVECANLLEQDDLGYLKLFQQVVKNPKAKSAIQERLNRN